MDYSTRPTSAYARFQFLNRDPTSALFWRGMIIAFLLSCLMMWIGLHAGRVMQRVKR
jgi:hypothetical protein